MRHDEAKHAVMQTSEIEALDLMQGQLTVANGVLFGATSTYAGSLDASLFALNTTDGTILNAVTLNNTLVQNGPSIVNNVLYQGSGINLTLFSSVAVMLSIVVLPRVYVSKGMHGCSAEAC